jgi:AcrR family transcriptional regulator
LDAAEEQFRRVGYHRTSVADIAAELGMSPANIYRFFPSRDAINESICGHVVNEVADIACTIARTNAPAMEKLDQLMTAVHHHNKMMLVKARPMHELISRANKSGQTETQITKGTDTSETGHATNVSQIGNQKGLGRDQPATTTNTHECNVNPNLHSPLTRLLPRKGC